MKKTQTEGENQKDRRGDLPINKLIKMGWCPEKERQQIMKV
jgi:hypothetical protein